MNPIRYAALSGSEKMFADLVLMRAQQLHVDEIDAVVKAVAAHVGNRVGEVMAKAFG